VGSTMDVGSGRENPEVSTSNTSLESAHVSSVIETLGLTRGTVKVKDAPLAEKLFTTAIHPED
jgi:hypothetical protein